MADTLDQTQTQVHQQALQKARTEPSYAQLDRGVRVQGEAEGAGVRNDICFVTSLFGCIFGLSRLC